MGGSPIDVRIKTLRTFKMAGAYLSTGLSGKPPKQTKECLKNHSLYNTRGGAENVSPDLTCPSGPQLQGGHSSFTPNTILTPRSLETSSPLQLQPPTRRLPASPDQYRRVPGYLHIAESSPISRYLPYPAHLKNIHPPRARIFACHVQSGQDTSKRF